MSANDIDYDSDKNETLELSNFRSKFIKGIMYGRIFPELDHEIFCNYYEYKFGWFPQFVIDYEYINQDGFDAYEEAFNNLITQYKIVLHSRIARNCSRKYEFTL